MAHEVVVAGTRTAITAAAASGGGDIQALIVSLTTQLTALCDLIDGLAQRIYALEHP